MRLCHLSLSNFRNYSRLDLDVPPGGSLFVGNNGSGKTALLEAIHCLATTKSHRALNDRELMSWWAGDDGIWPPVAHLRGFATRVGVAFQIADDALDADSDEACSLVRLIGADASRARAEAMLAEAIHLLEPFGAPAEPLREIARFTVTRST